MFRFNWYSNNMEINTLDAKYQQLLKYIHYFGTKKEDRTGTGTKSVFGQQIRHKMSEGFPLLTTKKMAIKSIMTELKWFLKGDTNIKYLVDNGCNIWNGDAYKKYAEQLVPGFHGPWYTQEQFIELIKTNEAFARDWGELGPIYGAQWRNWLTYRKTDEPNHFYQSQNIDQIANLINELKTNPDSRRLMVSAWNVGELEHMTLPPCHYGFQVYTRELNFYELRDNLRSSREGWFTETAVTLQDLQAESNKRGLPIRTISLMWNQRSVDTFLGLPFNIASYGMLLELLAKEVNMIPEEIIGNLGDTHLYLNHLEQATEQINREPMPHLPKLKLGKVDILNGEFEYEILHYHSHPAINAPLSN